MINAIDSLPEEHRKLVADIVATKAPGLLTSLQSATEPSRQEREAVEDILSTEFCNHLGPDYEATEYGRAIDNALGAFLLRWPVA